MKKMNEKIGVLVAVAVVCAGGGFYGGMVYGKTQTSSGNRQFVQGAPGARAASAARFGGGGAVFGTVISKDDTSITLQLAQMGGSITSTSSGQAGSPQAAVQTGTRIVLINPSTQVGKFVTGSATDLAVGASVTVNGTTNSDGSVTANQIQIRPSGSGAPGPRGQ